MITGSIGENWHSFRNEASCHQSERRKWEKPMIQGIDHVAITVADLDVACAFYERVLGARVEESYEVDGKLIVRRIALGGAILNVHQQGNGVDLVARHPLPGSTDICFRWNGPVETAQRLLEMNAIEIVDGPSPRTTADGKPGSSVYFRDPDGNLVELMGS
jgi:catechol 2,3-dioxygenase-like lactoylglutathione lyase family enzyme